MSYSIRVMSYSIRIIQLNRTMFATVDICLGNRAVTNCDNWNVFGKFRLELFRLNRLIRLSRLT